MRPKTDQYLAALFAESFKREVDSDEAVWRSLPFFAAALGLAITILSFAVQGAPPLAAAFWPIVIYLELGLAIISFGWAFRWFFNVVRPRDYQYPPTDLEVSEFAEGLVSYHEDEGLAGEALDEKVLKEVRSFMLAQFAAATTRNRENNIGKLEARSQVLLFLMIGFGFAFASEATIFGARALEHRWGSAAADGGQSNAGRGEGAAGSAADIAATHAATASDRERGSEAVTLAGNAQELGIAGVTQQKPPPAKPATQRPEPPKPVIVHRNDDPQPPRKP